MNTIDNRRLNIWSVVYNRRMYAKVSDIIKGLAILLLLICSIGKPLVLLNLPTCIYVDMVLPLSQFPRALRVQLPLSPIHMFRR